MKGVNLRRMSKSTRTSSRPDSARYSFTEWSNREITGTVSRMSANALRWSRNFGGEGGCCGGHHSCSPMVEEVPRSLVGGRASLFIAASITKMIVLVPVLVLVVWWVVSRLGERGQRQEAQRANLRF